MARVHNDPIHVRSTYNKLCYADVGSKAASTICRLASMGDDVDDMVKELSEFRPELTQQEVEMFGETGMRTGDEYLARIQRVARKYIRPILFRAKRIRIDDSAQFEILSLYYSGKLGFKRPESSVMVKACHASREIATLGMVAGLATPRLAAQKCGNIVLPDTMRDRDPVGLSCIYASETWR